MAKSLDKKRMELELVRVNAARHDLEFRIEEALDQIEKYKELIKTQQLKEDDLKQKLTLME